MNQQTADNHYPPVSDDILVDTGAIDPVFKEIYPRLEGFQLGSTNSWTGGHPFAFYQRMREESPVMWSRACKKLRGFGRYLGMTMSNTSSKIRSCFLRSAAA